MGITEKKVSLNDLAWVKRGNSRASRDSYNIPKQSADVRPSVKASCPCETDKESHAERLANTYKEYYEVIENVYDPYCDKLAAFRDCLSKSGLPEQTKWNDVWTLLSRDQKLPKKDVQRYYSSIRYGVSAIYKNFFDRVIETKDGKLDRRFVVRRVDRDSDAPTPGDTVVSVRSHHKVQWNCRGWKKLLSFSLPIEQTRGLGWIGKVTGYRKSKKTATIEWYSMYLQDSRGRQRYKFGPKLDVETYRQSVLEEKDVKLNDLMWAKTCDDISEGYRFESRLPYEPPALPHRRLTNAQRLLNRFIRVSKRCEES